MIDYPDLRISTEGYEPEWEDGTQVLRAASGTPWLYRMHDKERITLTITHPALSNEDEQMLRQFYRDHRDEVVQFHDPRTQQVYDVRMAHPPRLTSMAGGKLANIQMTLVGEMA